MATLTSLLLTALAVSVSATVENPKTQPTPPMGFNNWARFMCNLNETLFVKTADAMVSKGLLAAGYDNINLDDCWLLRERNAKKELQWDPELFPHGIPWLADYLHTRGFKFGIYENAGNMTCGWYPGSQDHEEIDAKTFESWGVDYLKLDGCHMDLQKGRSYYEEFEYRYKLWHKVMGNLKKPFIFSQSAPAYFSPNFHLDKNNTDWYRTMEYVRKNGELARHSDDIKVYSTLANQTFEPGGHWDSMMNNYGMEVRLARYQSCGFYNDPDFLTIDWPDLSMDEKKTHFALWSSFSAPLILSAWIPDLKKEDIEYLTNKDIIAVDQDALCEQATLVSQDGDIDVLTKNLANGDRLLTVLNRSDKTKSTTISLTRLGLDSSGFYKAKDLWTGKTSSVKKAIEVKLRTHQTTILRISTSEGKNNLTITPTGQIFNTFSLNCLTESTSHSSSSVKFTGCNAADEQVWQIASTGLVSPLSSNKCLSVDDGKVSLERCSEKDKSQVWSYGVSGNLVNGAKGLCLEEGSKSAVAKKCGYDLDSQVFALPGGVKLEN
ncbi:putative alpha-galactosidase A [Lindgomyces ingoldianus]|uniref:Alpha-galactosidase A n=1 Tax=Lindgomyces ingoldianus TaxID=673940 RepID=A0ACB6QF40_9PLEO|nr:putative alpha-galactosidase A [Lindgomyces ingoldianus]KAF2465506.1 putative alpha-galactosidase A [Lindgomyces ingoldianus]